MTTLANQIQTLYEAKLYEDVKKLVSSFLLIACYILFLYVDSKYRRTFLAVCIAGTSKHAHGQACGLSTRVVSDINLPFKSPVRKNTFQKHLTDG